MSGLSPYYLLELREDQRGVTTRPHKLNHPYRGAKAFRATAPDAPGTLMVYARDDEEARRHLINALFELIFRPGPGASAVANPPCPFCKGCTQSHGRNCAGRRNWRCLEPECGRYFVLDRTWRGGPNHPAAGKKPEFVRLLLAGVSVRDAADRLGIKMDTAANWADKVAANNPEAIGRLKCPCGKPMRHRGTCAYRLRRHLKERELTARLGIARKRGS